MRTKRRMKVKMKESQKVNSRRRKRTEIKQTKQAEGVLSEVCQRTGLAERWDRDRDRDRDREKRQTKQDEGVFSRVCQCWILAARW